MGQGPPAGGIGAASSNATPGYIGTPRRPRKISMVTIGAIVVGVLAVRAFVPPYSRGTGTAEQRNVLGFIGKHVQDSFGRTGRLCPSANGPIPRSLESVRGKKYTSSATDWATDPGFACLGVALDSPQYYRYDYRVVGNAFVATAQGDLDGDGRPSTFRLHGKVEDGHVVIEPRIEEDDPDE